MTYLVKTISKKTEMEDFLKVPYNIYSDDPNWVAPLKSEICRTLNTHINPYFSNAKLKMFVCCNGEGPKARMAVVINHEHWKKFGKKTAFFGFFESVYDKDISRKLFEAAEQYCRSEGAEYLEGPFNPNHYSELGLLIDNAGTPPAFFESHNPEYYSNLLENSGFRITCKMHTRINTDTANWVRQRYHIGPSVKKSGEYSVRHFRLHKMRSDLERIREVYNDSFSENWHFLPLTRKEYLFSCKYLLFVTSPKLITIVERGDEPVGVLQCMLNINKILQPLKGKINPLDYLRLLKKRRSISEIVIYAIGIKKKYQHTRVIKLLLDSMCETVQRYPVVSTTWMTDNNLAAIQASDLLGMKPYKWFAIYEKPLNK